MATDVVTLPREEFELLKKCQRIVESDFEEKFTKKFIEDIKKARKEYKKGEFVKFSTKKAALDYLDSL